jgi:four helix bundle protein
MTGRPHEKLEAWRESIKLAKMTYGETENFPDRERYGLTSQIRRAVVSIPANIAEGAARNSQAEFVRFLHISRGSLSELETLLVIAEELSFLEAKGAESLGRACERVGRLIDGVIRSIREKSASESKADYEVDDGSMG